MAALFLQFGEVRLKTLLALQGLYNCKEFIALLEPLTERFKVRKSLFSVQIYNVVLYPTVDVHSFGYVKT